MEKELRIGDITMSQIDAAWDTLRDATIAIDAALREGNDEARGMLAIMAVRHMIFSATFNPIMKIEADRLERKMAMEASAATREPINFSLIPNGDKS